MFICVLFPVNQLVNSEGNSSSRRFSK